MSRLDIDKATRPIEVVLYIQHGQEILSTVRKQLHKASLSPLQMRNRVGMSGTLDSLLVLLI